MQAVSPWLDALGRSDHGQTQAPLSEDLRCELAVIGGGIAGLHAALHAAELGHEVILLEARYCGYGASGRNAGHLTPTIGKDLPSLGLMYSLDKAQRLVAIAEVAVEFTLHTLESRQIDAHYESVGNVLAAVDPRQAKAIDRVLRWSRLLGASAASLAEQPEVHAGLPSFVHGGVHETVGGVLQPALYVDGLRRACLEAGVRVVEGCRVCGFERVSPGAIEVRHRHGRLTCERLLIANNAYAPELGLLRSRMVPMYVQLFMTAPLSPAQLAASGWGSRAGIYTAHEMLESYRLTHDHRIVGGAKMVRYAYGGRVLTETDRAWSQRHERLFRRRFPELRDVPIVNNWGGPIAMTLDFLPAVGRLKADPNIGYALAFAGHGLALAGYAGHQIVDELFGQHDGDRTLLDHRNWWIPPEPLRFLTARGLIGLFDWLDARVDRGAS